MNKLLRHHFWFGATSEYLHTIFQEEGLTVRVAALRLPVTFAILIGRSVATCEVEVDKQQH